MAPFVFRYRDTSSGVFLRAVYVLIGVCFFTQAAIVTTQYHSVFIR